MRREIHLSLVRYHNEAHKSYGAINIYMNTSFSLAILFFIIWPYTQEVYDMLPVCNSAKTTTIIFFI